MSRIQEILSKAERDGTARRTRSLSDEYAARPAEESRSERLPGGEAIHARGFVEPPRPRVVPAVPDAPRATPTGRSLGGAATAPTIVNEPRARTGDTTRIAPDVSAPGARIADVPVGDMAPPAIAELD